MAWKTEILTIITLLSKAKARRLYYWLCVPAGCQQCRNMGQWLQLQAESNLGQELSSIDAVALDRAEYPRAQLCRDSRAAVNEEARNSE